MGWRGGRDDLLRDVVAGRPFAERFGFDREECVRAIAVDITDGAAIFRAEAVQRPRDPAKDPILVQPDGAPSSSPATASRPSRSASRFSPLLRSRVLRFIHPHYLTHLWVLAAAGVVGFIGNKIAARERLRGGRRLNSPALTADGNHARVDSLVSLGVVGSALVVALGAPVADPIIGVVISLVILKITWDSWQTIYRADAMPAP